MNEVELIDSINQALAQQHWAHAVSGLKRLIAIHPDHAELHAQLAWSYHQLDDLAEARQSIAHAIRLQPDHAPYHFNAGIYWSDDHPNHKLRAISHYQIAHRLNPLDNSTLWNYSEMLRLNGHIDMAIELLEELRRREGIYRPFGAHRLVACYEIRRDPISDQKCVDLYEHIFKTEPENELAKWGYALFLLSRENMADGLQWFNRRYLSNRYNNAYCHDFGIPWWDGLWSSLPKGSTLILQGEQGLGDEMMYASCLNELLAEAKQRQIKIIIAVKKPLVRLFQESFKDVAAVIAHTTSKAPADISALNVTAQFPLGHLLALKRHSIDDFVTHQQAYLQANPDRVQYYDQKIKQLGRERVDGKHRLRVGLMWGTVPHETVSRFVQSAAVRSIHINQFAELSDLTDRVEFVSLQNHERGYEVGAVPELHIVDLSEDQADFYDTAAIIANLDLVISVDTSVSHLAGAMGKTTWVPLISNPDWRHGHHRDMSYWYTDTRYFHQSTPRQWKDVMAQIHLALKQYVKQHDKKS